MLHKNDKQNCFHRAKVLVYNPLQKNSYQLVCAYNQFPGMAPERQRNHDLDLLGSRDVIGHMTIRLAVGDFLWVVHSNHASILHRYGDMKS